MDGYIGGSTPDAGWWHDQIAEGLKYRKDNAFEARWVAWHKYYRGQWDKDILPVNLFFTMMRTIVPRVYFRNPSVSITPAKPGPLFMGFAKVLERTDEKLMRQMRLKQELKRIVEDTFLYGTGVGKMGFGAMFEYRHEGHIEAPTLGKNNERLEYRDYIAPNMPWFARTHPRSFIVPSGTQRVYEARWTTTIIERAVDDVRRDPRLSKNKRKDVGPGRFHTPENQRRGNRKSVGRRTNDTMVELAEIRDKKTGMVIVLAPSSRGNKPLVLFNGPDALMRNGFPDFTLTFNTDPEGFWGVPDSQILEPYQLEINEIRTQHMKHRRIALVKWLVQEGMMDDEEIKKMLSEDVAAVAKTKKRPDSVVSQTVLGEVPQSLVQAAQLIMQDVRESVGFSRNQFGEFNSRTADTTATEANIVKQASEIRVDERRDMTADLLVDIVEGIHSLIFEHWGTQEIVEVVGPGGVPVWVNFQPQMIKVGQYHIKVDPDNTLPETKQARERRALELYDRLKTNPIIDPFKLTQYLLHEMHGTAFDDMMRQLPAMGGSPNQPISPMDFGDMIRQGLGGQDGAALGEKFLQSQIQTARAPAAANAA